MKNSFSWIILFPILVICLFAPSCRRISTTTLPAPEDAIVVQLAADVNRDGIVDFDADEHEEELWTPHRGAIFMFNNDDDDSSGNPDWNDMVINGEDDLKDLAPLRLKILRALPEGARVAISTDPASIRHVRLLQKNPQGEYAAIDLSSRFFLDPAALRTGDMEFLIEAKSYADTSWSGETLLTACVETADGTKIEDSVRLRVAPFLLLSNAHKVKTLYVREFPQKNDELLVQIEAICKEAGVELFVIPAGEPYKYNHIWCQDAMEIGYSESPGVRQNVVLKANRDFSLDNFPKKSLLGPGFGWFEYSRYRPEFARGDWGNAWLDWYGNLECTPPIPGYPLGRIYYGVNGSASLNPEIVALLNAQGAQGPTLGVDTGWLLIKHVDEVICFMPSGKPDRPWKVLVVDPSAMLALAEAWVKEGRGDLTMLEGYEKEMSVKSFLNNTALVNHNKALAAERIAPIIANLKTEFSLEDNDFIHVPAWFDKNGKSVIPNMVNSVVMNGHFLISDPRGPHVKGRDLMQDYLTGLLADLPVKVHFVNDGQYHIWSGNIHCATNTCREGYEKPWWELLVPGQ